MFVTFYAGFTLLSKELIETFRELWMRRGNANEDIYTLVQELRDKVDRYNSREITIGLIKSIRELNESVLTVASVTSWWDILLFCLVIIYRYVSTSYKMRQEQVGNLWDGANVPF